MADQDEMARAAWQCASLLPAFRVVARLMICIALMTRPFFRRVKPQLHIWQFVHTVSLPNQSN